MVPESRVVMWHILVKDPFRVQTSNWSKDGKNGHVVQVSPMKVNPMAFVRSAEGEEPFFSVAGPYGRTWSWNTQEPYTKTVCLRAGTGSGEEQSPAIPVWAPGPTLPCTWLRAWLWSWLVGGNPRSTAYSLHSLGWVLAPPCSSSPWFNGDNNSFSLEGCCEDCMGCYM